MYEPALLNSVGLSKEDLWDDFKTYLINEKYSQASIRDRLSYTKRFYPILKANDVSSITSLKPDVKSHVTKALAALSKFLGMYDSWLTIIQRYHLKWSNGKSSLNTFKSIFEENGRPKLND